VNYLETKQVANVRTITGELIGGFILYAIPFGILYHILFSVISNRFSSNSLIALVILSIILKGISVFCIWRCSIATTFRKRLIDKKDIQTVMKNLIIFTAILCMITTLVNFSDINNKLFAYSSMMSPTSYTNYSYTVDGIAEYQAAKEKFINEAKKELYMHLVILEIGLFAVYFGMLPLQKKAILKNAV